MFRPRVIPCLLLKHPGLVKSVRFKDYRYIGDPINAVKIFNDLKADELVFLDITATKEKKTIDLDLLQKIGDECNMPFAVGGGIRNIGQIRDVLSTGAEKVIINTYAFENPDFIRQVADTFGTSTVVVSIDVKKKRMGREEVVTHGAAKSTGFDPLDHALRMERMGAGEIIINSVDRDGSMEGYDIDLIKKITGALNIPVIALGGAGKPDDLREAIHTGGASAVAAGSLFVYHGPRRAVLINFPSQEELIRLFT